MTSIRVCILCIHYKFNFVYTYIGTITGFTNLGDIASHLSAFEKSIEQDSDVEEHVLANSMLVLWSRDFSTSWSSHIANFHARRCLEMRGMIFYGRLLDG